MEGSEDGLFGRGAPGALEPALYVELVEIGAFENGNLAVALGQADDLSALAAVGLERTEVVARRVFVSVAEGELVLCVKVLFEVFAQLLKVFLERSDVLQVL